MLIPDEYLSKAVELSDSIKIAVAAWDKDRNPDLLIQLIRTHYIVLRDPQISRIMLQWLTIGRTDLLHAARFSPHERQDMDHVERQRFVLYIQNKVNELVAAGLSKQKAIEALSNDPRGLGFSATNRMHLSFKQIEKLYYTKIQISYYYRIDGNQVIFGVEPTKIVVNGLTIFGEWELKLPLIFIQ